MVEIRKSVKIVCADRFFKQMFLLMVIVVLFSENIFAQIDGFPKNVTNPGKNIGIDKDKECAPVTGKLNGYYNLKIPNTELSIVDEVVFDIDWGNGVVTNVQPIVSILTPSDGSYTTYKFSLDGYQATRFEREYPAGQLNCLYEIKVWIKANNGATRAVELTTTLDTYHQTDTYNGAQQLILIEPNSGKGDVGDPYLVCAGQKICIQFQDQTILDCNPNGAALFEKNDQPRVLQFEYGVAGDLNGMTSYIPNISVNGQTITNAAGAIVATRYDGGELANHSSWHTIETPSQTTGRNTNEVCVGETTLADVGKLFYVRIYNWNKCNQYTGYPNGDPSSYRSVAVEKLAVIKIVESPPPPTPAQLEFCHGKHYTTVTESRYTHTLSHNSTGWTPGYYNWYDNKGNLIYTSQKLTNPGNPGSPAAALDFNPVSMLPAGSPFFPAPKLVTSPGDNGDTISYFATYKYDNPDPKLPDCESTKAKVKYTIRANISQAPDNQTLTVCERTTNYRIYARTGSVKTPPAYTFGGQTRYVWTAGTGVTIVATGTNGEYVDVNFTGSVAATATNPGTATISVYQEWVDATTDGSRCPSATRTLTITVNPLPEASIIGTATYCPNEQAKVTINGIKGRGANNNFTLELTTDGGASALTPSYTGLTSGDDKSLNVTVANGTAVTYQIMSLTDVGTGCVARFGPPANANLHSTSPELTGSATITKRSALTLADHINGSNPVCNGAATSYQIVNTSNAGIGPASSQPITNGTAQPTQYLWTNMQSPVTSATTTADNVTSFTFSNTTSAAINTSVEVYWRYETAAIATVSGVQSSGIAKENYCPSNTLSMPVTVYPAPTATIAGVRTVCPNSTPGATVDIPVTVTGVAGQAWTVKWTVNGIPGTTTVPAAVGATATGTITVPFSSLPTGTTQTLTLTEVTQAPASCVGTTSGPVRIEVTPRVEGKLILGTAICATATNAQVQIELTGAPVGSRYRVTYRTNGTARTAVEINSTGAAATTYTLTIPISQINTAVTGATVISLDKVEIINFTGIDYALHECDGTADPATVNVDVTVPDTANITSPPVNSCGSLSTAPLTAVPAGAGWDGAWTLESCPSAHPAGTGFGAPISQANNTFSPNVPGIYVLRWTLTAQTSGVCSTVYDEITYSWGVPVAIPNAGNDDYICGNGPYTLNAAPARPTLETGKWTVSPSNTGTGTVDFVDDSNPNTTVSVSQPGAYTLRWTLSSGSCPSASDDVVIDFRVIPSIQTVTTGSPYCPGDPITVTLATSNTPPAGTTYTFNVNELSLAIQPSPNQNILARSAAPANNSTASDTYTTTVRPNYNGCQGTSNSFDIVVKPKPELKPMSTIEVCPQTKIVFELVRYPTGQPVTYQWNNSNTLIGLPAGGSFLAANDGNTYSFTTATNNTAAPYVGNITNLQAEVDGCYSTINSNFSITVNPTPVISNAPNITLCPNEQFVHDVSNTFTTIVPLTTWNWTYVNNPDAVTTSTVLNTPGTTNYIPDFRARENTSARDYTGKVTVTATAKCSYETTFNIIVHPRPTVTATNNTQTKCAVHPSETPPNGTWEPVTFSSQLTGTNYTWREYGFNSTTYAPIETTGSGNITGKLFYDNPTAGYLNTVIWAKGKSIDECISDSISIRLNLKPLPVITVPGSQTYCGGEAVNQIYNEFSSSTPSTEFEWTNNNTNTGLAYAYQSGLDYLPTFTTQVNSGAAEVSTIEVWGTKEQCIGAKSSYTITVNPIPIVKKPDNMSICPSTTAPPVNLELSNTLGAGTNIEYSWSSNNVDVGSLTPGTAFATIGTPPNPQIPSFMSNTNGNLTGNASPKYTTVTIEAVVRNSNGSTCGHSSGNASYIITLKPTPRVTSAIDPVVEKCPGERFDQVNFGINITGATADSVYWRVSNPAVSSSDPANQPATIPFLSATGIGNIKAFWGVPNDYHPVTNPTAANLTSTVYYRPSYQGCIGVEQSYIINVKPTPDVTVPANQSYCDGMTVSSNLPSSSPNYLPPFESPTPGNVTFHWYKDDKRISTIPTFLNDAFTGSDDQIPTFDTENTSSIDNKLSPVTSIFEAEAILNSCRSPRKSFSITIKPVPQLAPYDNITVCAGTPFIPDAFDILPAAVVGDVVAYSWGSSNIFTEMRLADTNPSPPPAFTPGAQYPNAGDGYLPAFIGDTTKTAYSPNHLWGDMWQRATFSVTPFLNGCRGVTKNNLQVTINPLPITQIAQPEDGCVGDGDIKVYQISKNSANSVYYWENGVRDDNVIAPLGKGPVTMSFYNSTPRDTSYYQNYKFPLDAENWSGYISVRERNLYGCWGPLEKRHINVVAKPKVDAGRPRVVCEGDTIHLNGQVLNRDLTATYKYEWYPSTYIMANYDAINPILRPRSTSVLRFKAGIGDCISDGDTVRITVLPQPEMPLIQNATYCDSHSTLKMITFGAVDPTTDSNYKIHWFRDISMTTVPDTVRFFTGDSVALSMKLHPGALPPNSLVPPRPIDWSATSSMDTIIYYRVYQSYSQTYHGEPFTCRSDLSPQARLTIRRSPDAPTVKNFAYCEDPRGRYTIYAESSKGAPILNWYINGSFAGAGDRISASPLSTNGLSSSPVDTPESPGNPATYVPFVYEVESFSGFCPSPPAYVELTIYPNPKLGLDLFDQYGVKKDEGCSPFQLNAVVRSPSAYVKYQWEWPDATTILTPPTTVFDSAKHTFRVTGTVPEPVMIKLVGISLENRDSEELDPLKGFCSSERDTFLTVFPGVVADFDVLSPAEGCDPLYVAFRGSKSSNAHNHRWYWDWNTANGASPPYPGNHQNNFPVEQPVPGDPNDPYYGRIGPNPPNTFENKNSYLPRTYHVWLQVDNNACYDQKDTIITVFPSPVALFEHNLKSSGNSVCPPDPVIFTNLSNSPANVTNATDTTWYAWNFGDGGLDTIAHPSTSVPPYPTISHQYESLNASAPIGYNIALTAFNRYVSAITGEIYTCKSTNYEFIYVKPQVIADFIADTAGCSPALTTFQSPGNNGAISYWRWDFGDGTPEVAGPIATHLFENHTHDSEMKVNVHLTVGSSYGCTDAISKPFTVYPEPAATFNIPNEQQQGCQPLRTIITNTSNSGGSMNPVNTLYIFDYRDGQVDSIRYPTTTLLPSHEHVFTNTLGTNLQLRPFMTAVNDWGCRKKSDEIPITVYPFIKATFDVDTVRGCSPLTITFRNGSQGFAEYFYDFGDGSTKTGYRNENLFYSKKFTNPSMSDDADYMVILKVRSSSDCWDADTMKITIYSQPVADFLPGPPYPGDFLFPAPPIVLNNRIPASERDKLFYLWSYTEQGSSYVNNFSTAINPTPLDRLTDWGTYQISQRVTARNGICSDSKTVTINIVPPPARANFDPVEPGCMPYDVKTGGVLGFVNTSVYATRYLWDFGDRTYSNEENPKHTYTDAGTYKVTLTVSGDNQFPSSFSRIVEVYPQPQASFQVAPNFLYVGMPLRAFNYTAHALSNGQPYDVWYRWDWGDNTPNDTVENPSHMYLKKGNYSVTLTSGTYTNPQCISVAKLDNAVELENAGDIILPNVFKPRTSGEPSDVIPERGYKNYLFYPPVVTPVVKYHFVIYSRWGQKLYETHDPGCGWNGYFRGRLCDEGVYTYKIDGVYQTGQSFSIIGDVTLLR